MNALINFLSQKIILVLSLTFYISLGEASAQSRNEVVREYGKLVKEYNLLIEKKFEIAKKHNALVARFNKLFISNKDLKRKYGLLSHERDALQSETSAWTAKYKKLKREDKSKQVVQKTLLVFFTKLKASYSAKQYTKTLVFIDLINEYIKKFEADFPHLFSPRLKFDLKSLELDAYVNLNWNLLEAGKKVNEKEVSACVAAYKGAGFFKMIKAIKLVDGHYDLMLKLGSIASECGVEDPQLYKIFSDLGLSKYIDDAGVGVLKPHSKFLEIFSASSEKL